MYLMQTEAKLPCLKMLQYKNMQCHALNKKCLGRVVATLCPWPPSLGMLQGGARHQKATNK